MATENGEQSRLGTQENPQPVETQFINGRGPNEGVHWVTQPHPSWKPGDKQPNPWGSTDWLRLVPDELGAAHAYPLLISSVTPRPIAFISSQSKKGIVNLAPYSYFNAMAHDPPTLVMGHCKVKPDVKKDGQKDSLANIMETGELVVNIISEWFLEASNHTCGAYDDDVDEMALANLTPVPSEMVAPPRVAESAIQMECKLRSTYDVKNKNGEVTTTIIIAEVVLFHILKEVAGKSPHGKTIVDVNKLRPMSRFGGNIYGTSGTCFEIPRPPKEAQEAQKPSKPQ